MDQHFQNILVNPANTTLKVCDLGSAKRLIPGERNVSYICSRFYRAPELLLGSTNYSMAIDMWATGCVLAEMFTGQTFFDGRNNHEVMDDVMRVSPNENGFV